MTDDTTSTPDDYSIDLDNYHAETLLLTLSAELKNADEENPVRDIIEAVHDHFVNADREDGLVTATMTPHQWSMLYGAAHTAATGMSDTPCGVSRHGAERAAAALQTASPPPVADAITLTKRRYDALRKLDDTEVEDQ